MNVRRPTRGKQRAMAVLGAAIALALTLAWRLSTGAESRGLVTLSIVGTTDLHGDIFPREGRGGLAVFGGYVRNLRASRAADGGDVLLIDSGDTFQGGIESNLSEGAVVIDAYEALGYTAAVIGNHEFDFGPVDDPRARQRVHDDPRGAIKARAAQARFPYLAANLIDEETNQRVDWPNVHASVLVEAAGVKVGIIGVMTIDALRATLRANVQGLRVAPLAATVTAEARRLRTAGAEIVVVGSHAGGSCTAFDDARDLSSCDVDAEMFRVAREVPRGLIDVIVAGHTHQALAHEVEGVALIQAYSHGRAFSRVDVAFDRRTRRVVKHTLMAPVDICASQDPTTLACESTAGPLPPARYEDRDVAADTRVEAAMAPALARVRALQATALGIVLDTPLPRTGDGESTLGNLFADALRDRTPGADLAINNNVRGGLRADLPQGPLTFGRFYDSFPFDNRLVTVTLTGTDLRRLFAEEARRNRPGALSVSGMRVRVACTGGDVDIELSRPSGEKITAEERLVVVAIDQLVQGFLFAPLELPPEQRFATPDAPVMREAVEEWLQRHGGRLRAEEFTEAGRPRIGYASGAPAACAL